MLSKFAQHEQKLNHLFDPLLPNTAPTAPPVNIINTSVNSTSISLNWDEPPVEHQNGMIREYHVNITEIETGNQFSMVVSAESATISSLHPFYQYSITVTAVTVLPGPASPSIVIETLQGNRIIFALRDKHII